MKTLPATFAVLALLAPALAHDAKAPAPPIELAICLDTSNSMDGLIDSAKIKLWAVVNELARAKPTPRLRVALYAYGSPAYGAASGYVRRELAFTEDLDRVYERLNALTTRGGDEYVARVVRAACGELDWSDGPGLRLVVVAGNEGAGQDPEFAVKDVFRAAIGKGIQIDTVYCGSPSDPLADGWREAAALADGKFACIDQSRDTRVVTTPMDGRLAELSGSLNRTYVGFGARGKEGKELQSRMDASAGQAAPSAEAERACAKAGGLYRQSEWDLLDAVEEGRVDPGRMEASLLPEEMHDLDGAGRKAYLERKAAERKALQEEILKLGAEREAYLKGEAAKAGGAEQAGFDKALRDALREQAARKGFRFE